MKNTYALSIPIAFGSFVLLGLILFLPQKVSAQVLYDTITSPGPTVNPYQGNYFINIGDVGADVSVGSLQTAIIYFSGHLNTPFSVKVVNNDVDLDCVSQTLTPADTSNAIQWGDSPQTTPSPVLWVFSGTECSGIDTTVGSGLSLAITSLNMVFLEALGDTDIQYARVYSQSAGNTDTRIVWVSPPPTNQASTTSRTFDVEFDYYFNTLQSDPATFDYILLQMYPLAYPSYPPERFTVENPLVHDSLTSVSFEVTTQNDGYYMGILSYWNGVPQNVECAWYDIFCTEDQVVVGISASNKFNVATTTIAAEVPPYLRQSLSDSCTEIESTWVLGLDVAVCKAIAYLFVPSPTLFDDASRNFNETLSYQMPFAPFYKFTQSIEGASTGEAEMSSDLDVDLGPLSIGAFKLFSWSMARENIALMFNYPLVADTLKYGSTILMFVYFVRRLDRSPVDSRDQV